MSELLNRIENEQLTRKDLAELRAEQPVAGILLDGTLADEFPSEDEYLIKKFSEGKLTRKELAERISSNDSESRTANVLLNGNV